MTDCVPVHTRIDKHNVTVEDIAGWAVACVIAGCASYWTGERWSCDERKAKVFTVKSDASAFLAADILFSRSRLVIVGRAPCIYNAFPTVFGA